MEAVSAEQRGVCLDHMVHACPLCGIKDRSQFIRELREQEHLNLEYNREIGRLLGTIDQAKKQHETDKNFIQGLSDKIENLRTLFQLAEKISKI